VDPLRPLHLEAGWIYEVVVCTNVEGSPHAAPTGVWTRDHRTLQMDLYGSSRTLRGIMATGVFAADFPRDAEAFFTVLHAPAELAFDGSRAGAAPCLADSCATVELTLAGAEQSGATTRITGSVANVTLREGVRLFNRAEGLLLESLILATRLGHLPRPTVLAQLHENRRVVDKVAPDSTYAKAMRHLDREVSESS
jgi:hypothetical protein